MNNVDVARCVAWSRTSRITLGCALSLLVVGCDSDVESENSAAEAAAPLSPPAAGAGESPSNAFAAPPSPAASDEVDDACATPPEGAPQCEPGGDGYYWSPYQSVVGSAEGQIPGVDVHDADSSSRYGAVRAFSVDDDGEVVEDYNEIVTLHRAPISAERYEAIRAAKDPPPEPAVEPVVRAALVDALGALDGDAVVHVQARTRGPETEMLQIARNRAVALGLIETQSDRVSFDAVALEKKRDIVADYLDPIIAEVEELGGTVVYQCMHAGCFDVLVPAGAVDALADHPEITTLDTVHQMDAATNTINGVGIEQVYQTNQYMDHSAVYDGDSWGSSTSVAIMEFQEYFDEHPVFKESSATTTRILTRRECDSNSCSNVTNFPGAGSHATFTASLLFGDVTDVTVHAPRSVEVRINTARGIDARARS